MVFTPGFTAPEILGKLLGNLNKQDKVIIKKDEYKHGGKPIMPIIPTTKEAINHCLVDSLMSICDATNLRNSNEKYEAQKKCDHFMKATQEDRCMFEVYKEYCWNHKAQIAAKKGI